MSGSENPLPEPRPAASLTAGLLARRGAARPAMRRQPLGALHAAQPIHEDLGWNDMGDDPVVPVVEIEASAPATPITELLHVLAERINAKPVRKTRSVVPLVDSGRRAAFTLRIDAERHLRLRLLSAMTNRSAQRLLIEALDELIIRNDQLKDLAKQVEDGIPEPGMKWGS